MLSQKNFKYSVDFLAASAGARRGVAIYIPADQDYAAHIKSISLDVTTRNGANDEVLLAMGRGLILGGLWPDDPAVDTFAIGPRESLDSDILGYEAAPTLLNAVGVAESSLSVGDIQRAALMEVFGATEITGNDNRIKSFDVDCVIKPKNTAAFVDYFMVAFADTGDQDFTRVKLNVMGEFIKVK
jgi:hypothetical protein